MKKKLLMTYLILKSTLAFAWFCPTNFNDVSPGDSIDRVLQQCGNPSSQKTYQSKSNLPEEWSFFITMTPSGASPGLSPQPSLKMSAVFLNNQLVNINVNGTSLVSTSICGGTIQLGNTPAMVQAACGKPSFINQGQPPQNAPSATEVTEFTYSGSPSVTLTFENGILKSRK